MNHKLKLLTAALTSSLVSISAAHAMTVDIGAVPANATFAQVISKSVGTFSDTWIFDVVGSPILAGGSISNLSISLSPLVNLFNVDGLSVQLYRGDNTLIQDLDLAPGSSAQIKLGSGVFPPADDYYFSVSGNANGMLGGQYVFAVTTLPVPEPETWAMLVAGLGLVGLQLRRRSNAGRISIN